MSDVSAMTLRRHLWPRGNDPEGPQVYALIDGARNRRIAPWIRLKTLNYECLYSGTLTPRLQDAAPYIVRLNHDEPFTMELLERAWGNAWGVFTRVAAGVTIEQQRRHFRKLLMVKDEAGRRLVFRFYDPRVLRVYLPTCRPAETDEFFGPVHEMLMESEDAREILVFEHRPQGLSQREIPV